MNGEEAEDTFGTYRRSKKISRVTPMGFGTPSVSLHQSLQFEALHGSLPPHFGFGI